MVLIGRLIFFHPDIIDVSPPPDSNDNYYYAQDNRTGKYKIDTKITQDHRSSHKAFGLGISKYLLLVPNCQYPEAGRKITCTIFVI